jgi:hypothetical protein
MYFEQAELIHRGSKLSGNNLRIHLSLVAGKWIRIILWARNVYHPLTWQVPTWNNLLPVCIKVNVTVIQTRHGNAVWNSQYVPSATVTLSVFMFCYLLMHLRFITITLWLFQVTYVVWKVLGLNHRWQHYRQEFFFYHPNWYIFQKHPCEIASHSVK